MFWMRTYLCMCFCCLFLYLSSCTLFDKFTVIFTVSPLFMLFNIFTKETYNPLKKDKNLEKKMKLIAILTHKDTHYEKIPSNAIAATTPRLENDQGWSLVEKNESISLERSIKYPIRLQHWITNVIKILRRTKLDQHLNVWRRGTWGFDPFTLSWKRSRRLLRKRSESYLVCTVSWDCTTRSNPIDWKWGQRLICWEKPSRLLCIIFGVRRWRIKLWI